MLFRCFKLQPVVPVYQGHSLTDVRQVTCVQCPSCGILNCNSEIMELQKHEHFLLLDFVGIKFKSNTLLTKFTKIN